MRGKIDESAYKYNKVYGTDVTNGIQYGKDSDGKQYGESKAESDVARLKEIETQVNTKKATKTQAEINTKENKDLLEAYAKEKAQIKKLLFEIPSPIIATTMRSNIRWIIEKLEPRVELHNVDVEMHDDGRGYIINIKYMIKALRENDEVTFNISRVR